MFKIIKKALFGFIVLTGISQTAANTMTAIGIHGPQDNTVVKGFREGAKAFHLSWAARLDATPEDLETMKDIQNIMKK